jgi:hypothetical protein
MKGHVSALRLRGLMILKKQWPKVSIKRGLSLFRSVLRARLRSQLVGIEAGAWDGA